MNIDFFQVFGSVNFWSAFCGWTAAQCTKMLCTFVQTRRFDFHYFVSTGGMPSAHSAMACGLATSVGISTGFDSTLFVLALAFALVTMFDATTVRRATGMQATLLNEITSELFHEGRFPNKKLAEFLGHTRLEVVLGMTMGVLMAMLTHAIAFFIAD